MNQELNSWPKEVGKEAVVSWQGEKPDHIQLHLPTAFCQLPTLLIDVTIYPVRSIKE